MKYYNTGKEGFMKAWYKAGLKYWYLFLISMIIFSFTLSILDKDLSMFNTQQIVIAILLLVFLDLSITQILFDKVLDYMEEHDYMTTDKKRKNCYKNLEFQPDEKMYESDEK